MDSMDGDWLPGAAEGAGGANESGDKWNSRMYGLLSGEGTPGAAV
jgi:hypothetical protein